MYRPIAALLLSLTLASCASWRTPSVQSEPPRVDCAERTPAEPLPRKPVTTFWEDWAVYSRKLLGILAIEVNSRAEVSDCLQRLRDEGAIR